MAPVLSTLASLCALAGAVSGAAVVNERAALEQRQLPSAYAPLTVPCPRSSLNRAANGLGTAETAYIAGRRTKADAALAAWLRRVDPAFDTSKLPVLGLSTSGGGYRSLLNGAGVVQAFDERDSNVGTSGVFQGLSYYSGLSGGAWLLSSLSGNNWPTISVLRDTLWADRFEDSLLVPNNLLSALAYVAVINDILAKNAAGFDPTVVDPWGRLLSYQLLRGINGGVLERLSGLANKANLTSHNVPFPIMTALGVETFQGQCTPQFNSTQYEFTPYEFGSWDAGIRAFTNAAFLGTNQTNNAPTSRLRCTINYDNLGYIFGTSSDIFSDICGIIPPSNGTLAGALQDIITRAHPPSSDDTYGIFTNPFYRSPGSPLIASQTQLNLADGGLGDQNNPLWPLIQPERPLSAVIVNDNSADTDDNFPDGREIRNTYLRAREVGLTKMPPVPDNATFVAQGLNKRATFFGCDDPETITMVFLPNVAYDFMSNTATAKVQYSRNETAGVIGNGNLIATQNGDAEWPRCLGCAVQLKTGTTLPDGCQACLDRYCYRGPV
ncbi:Lysophospholipase 1 [Elsinoe australis]|uniref:Lysophospholipase n=1 Tax=Elsinoe australis TaxID=40998 RepID=A0A2P7YGB7_9PEZI|nr:Lysophospholipase 1 [Elsinoe australis]